MDNWVADIVDGRIHLKTPYSKNIKEAVKSIQGARWHPHKSLWTYPIHWEVCNQIREQAKHFKAKLEIGDALWDWAKAEKLRQQSIPSVGSMERVELVNVIKTNPALAEKLRDYQTVGVAFGARNKEVLVGDEPGLGKTVQVIGAVLENALGGPVLVISPKSAAVATWPQQIAFWAPGDRFIVIGTNLKAPERRTALLEVYAWCDANPGKHCWVSMNADYLRAKAQVDSYQNYVYVKGKKVIEFGTYAVPEIFDREWAGLIVDECHITLAGSTGNKKKWSQQRFGLDLVPIAQGGVKIAMSGTPFRGKKENAWGILNWLRPDLYTSYWKWVKKHFVTFEDELNQTQVMSDQVKSVDAFYEDLSRVMLRRTKHEVAKDLPAKQYAGTPLDPNDPFSPIAVWLPMTKKQASDYKKFARMGEVALEGGTVAAVGILAEVTRRKQFANAVHKYVGDQISPTIESNKIQWIEGWLEDRNWLRDEDSTKIIIASQFAKFVNLIGDMLDSHGVAYHKLTGATSAKRRAEMQERFQQDGGPMVFILSTKAGGTSITLDAADDVIITDETNDPDEQEQVEDRAHRISRVDHQVTIWYLHSLGTIEEDIATVTGERNADIKKILDGARGIEQIKTILNYSVKGLK